MQIPIRSNVGINNPEGKYIGKREIYVFQKNNGEYELWIGDNNNGLAKELTVKNAENSKAINTGNLINVANGSDEGIIAGLTVSISGNNINIEPQTGKNATLKSVTLDDIQKLVVNESNYGSDPSQVENPVPGQLYFKI